MGTRRSVLLAVAMVLPACNDQGLQVLHNPPAVAILEPSDGTSLYEGQPLTFRAEVTSEDAPGSIQALWVSTTETMCPPAPLDDATQSTCTFAFADAGQRTVTVTATDSQGDSASATVTVSVLENAPPTIEIRSPVDGTVFEPGETVTLEANVADMEDDASSVAVAVISSRDGDLGFTAVPASDGSYVAATSSLSSGSHVLVARATDPSGRSGQDNVQVLINGRPGPPEVAIEPGAARAGQKLTAVITTESVDPEGDVVRYTYDWYVNGTPFSSGTTAWVPSGLSVRGEVWEVVVRPYDAYGYGEEGSAERTIDNSPPRLTSVALSPPSAKTDDDITSMASGWFDQDGDAEAYHIAWYVNGTLDVGEVAAVYPATKTSTGDRLQASYTPYDADDEGTPVYSSIITIGNTAPTAPGVVVSPAAPEPEDDLTCGVTVDATDADGDAITYSYTWYQNGVLSPVTGAFVDDAYTEHGDTWECRVVADDGASTSSYGSDSVVVTDATAPDAPTVDKLVAYRNETEATLTGTCEADCTLHITCSDSSSSWAAFEATCGSDGKYSTTLTGLTRGDITACYLQCEDAAGNLSSSSSTVSTEVCDPYDKYEDSSGYGDTTAKSIDLWSALPDDASTTISIEGNVLDRTDVDWYVIDTSDDVTADAKALANDYNFKVELTSGSSDYELWVYKGSTVSTGYPTTAECSTKGTAGTTSYSDYVSTRACSSGNALGYNNCEDMSDAYYIKVQRLSTSAISCQGYTLTITNGVW